jgi:hypothetical protein
LKYEGIQRLVAYDSWTGTHFGVIYEIIFVVEEIVKNRCGRIT